MDHPFNYYDFKEKINGSEGNRMPARGETHCGGRKKLTYLDLAHYITD